MGDHALAELFYIIPRFFSISFVLQLSFFIFFLLFGLTIIRIIYILFVVCMRKIFIFSSRLFIKDPRNNEIKKDFDKIKPHKQIEKPVEKKYSCFTLEQLKVMMDDHYRMDQIFQIDNDGKMSRREEVCIIKTPEGESLALIWDFGKIQ